MHEEGGLHGCVHVQQECLRNCVYVRIENTLLAKSCVYMCMRALFFRKRVCVCMRAPFFRCPS